MKMEKIYKNDGWTWSKEFKSDIDQNFKKTGDVVIDSIFKLFFLNVYFQYLFLILPPYLILYFSSVFIYNIGYFSPHFLWLSIVFYFIICLVYIILERFTGFNTYLLYKSEQYKYTESLNNNITNNNITNNNITNNKQ